MGEKERRDNVTILFPHLCFKVAPCSSYRESLELSLSYTSGNFHYRNWLVYSNDGLPQMPDVLMSKQVQCTPLSFLLSFHKLIDLVHPLHGNPYSSYWHQLMGISIARWLATSMLDFLLFCLLHTTSTIIFYSTHSAMSMAHAHVLRESWKKFEITKVRMNCLAETGVVHDGSILCDENET